MGAPMALPTPSLGFRLPHPLMPGASPMVDSLDTVQRLEEAGAAAIVMHSLFEEQILQEQWATIYHMDVHAESFGEALSYFPRPGEFALGPEQYLAQIARIKKAVHIPVIASLNGTTAGGWGEYARRAGGGRRRAHRPGRDQGDHGRRPCRADGLRSAAARARVPAHSPRRDVHLDGRPRVHLPAADAGKHEPGPLPRSGRLRTGQLHPGAAGMESLSSRCYP